MPATVITNAVPLTDDELHTAFGFATAEDAVAWPATDHRDTAARRRWHEWHAAGRPAR